MPTQTRTGAYLNKMAQGGHFKQKLGETALALTECMCKADRRSRRVIADHLVDEVRTVLINVYGWGHPDAQEMAVELANSFRQAREVKT